MNGPVSEFPAISNSIAKRTGQAADIQARKAYLGAVISEVRVGDEKVEIIGDKASLAAVITGQQAAAGKVSGFVRKWRAKLPSG